jgi:hypothetical protein
MPANIREAATFVAIVVLAFGFVLSMDGLMEHTARETAKEVMAGASSDATATPPRNGSIRTWAADGHWWVVGDGWGVHHPGCPCHAKAEVE